MSYVWTLLLFILYRDLINYWANRIQIINKSSKYTYKWPVVAFSLTKNYLPPTTPMYLTYHVFLNYASDVFFCNLVLYSIPKGHVISEVIHLKWHLWIMQLLKKKNTNSHNSLLAKIWRLKQLSYHLHFVKVTQAVVHLTINICRWLHIYINTILLKI